MTTFSEFQDRHDVGGEWAVRFTADEHRARDVAEQYRRSGFAVRVLPLSEDDTELDVSSFEVGAVDYSPIREVDGDSCTTCLGAGTYVVVTRAVGETAEDELVY